MELTGVENSFIDSPTGIGLVFERLDCEVDGSEGWYVGVFYSKCVLDFDRFDKHAAVSQDHLASMESHSVVSRTKRERGDLVRCCYFIVKS